MSYISDNLATDEQIIFRARIHWILFISPIFYILSAVFFFFDGLGAIVRTFGLEAAHKTFGFTSLVQQIEKMTGLDAHIIVSISFILISAYYIWKRTMKFLTTEIGLTNNRVIIKIGLIRLDVIELVLDRIEASLVQQTIFGRLFGYGTLSIIGSANTGGSFRWIKNPVAFNKAIQKQISLRSKNASSHDLEQHHEPQMDI